MCRWLDADCSVSLNAAITHSLWFLWMSCYGYGNETKLVVGWLEDELMRILRFFVVGIVWGGHPGCD